MWGETTAEFVHPEPCGPLAETKFTWNDLQRAGILNRCLAGTCEADIYFITSLTDGLL